MVLTKLTQLLTASVLLLATIGLSGCQQAPETDGPVSATEQEELQDQLEMIEKMEQQNR